MPVNKILATKRGKAYIAAALIAAASGTWGAVNGLAPKREYPASVILAVDALIEPWEGLALTSHWDRFAKIWDICHGETRINGKPVQPGMKFTRAECKTMLLDRVYTDYYTPLTKCVANFDGKPVGLGASMISGAYNFGVGGMCGSTTARFAREGKYREACIAQTAWNKAGGQVVEGLVRRREMGDAQRTGEAEICVSGL